MKRLWLWLHRECAFLLDRWGETEFGAKYNTLPLERRARLRGHLESVMRPNTYDTAGTPSVRRPRAWNSEA